MKKKNEDISSFATKIFVLFIIFSVIVSGILTYIIQSDIASKQRQKEIDGFFNYVENVFNIGNEEFEVFQEFLSRYHNEIHPNINNHDNWEQMRQRFYMDVFEHHGAVALGESFPYESLLESEQKWFAEWKYLYYYTMIESAKDIFNISSAGYMVSAPDHDEYVYIYGSIDNENHEDWWVYSGLTTENIWDTNSNEYTYKQVIINNMPCGVLYIKNDTGYNLRTYLPYILIQMISICTVMVGCLLVLLTLIKQKFLQKSAFDYQRFNKKEEQINIKTNKDTLTGVRNNSAYYDEMRKVELEIENGEVDLGIAMIDLDGLRKINDTYGNDKGNVSLIKICRLTCQIFDHSPVFRLGGDEFIVVLKKKDFENRKQLIDDFNKEIDRISNDESLDPWERVSATLGVAIYDPKVDSSFANVFRRASKDLSKHKDHSKSLNR